MQYALAVVAAVVGGILEGEFGFVFGGLVGWAVVLVWRQGRDLKLLRRQIDSLVDRQDPPTATAETRPETPQPAPSAQAVAPQHSTAAPAPRSPLPSPPSPPPPLSPPPSPKPPVWARSGEPAAPSDRSPSSFELLVDELFERAKNFFTTGNLVVRVGVVVLFFGVAFLLNYAYENSLLPVEFRLAGAALGGLALSIVGWHLRHRSDTYGLILQGAGVGLLYLTIFASARLYELLPMTGALGLLLALVAGSSMLAVLQKSQALAIFAMSGGFLAPVLLSTGSGSHVALFSYYALLNAGILAMAWFQFWRWLNWVGFVFTFVIGATWGYEYYRPELYTSTQPFLILFFVFYVSVSVLFARRQEVELRGLVDGTLVFGTPIVAFALQAALVRDMPFGLAFSALGAAATYVLLALWLKRQQRFSELLGQSFVALGVVFATLTIPFAFDNQRFTGATWALEGAGLFWVGLRQQHRLPRAFGCLLILAAAVAFFAEGGSTVTTLFLNSSFLGAALLSLAAGYVAYLISTHAELLHKIERPLRWLYLPFSTFWWLAGVIHEVGNYVPGGNVSVDSSNVNENLVVGLLALSTVALTEIARRCNWKEGFLPGLLLLPVMVIWNIEILDRWQMSTALADFGWLAWPVAFAGFAWHLRNIRGYPRLAAAWHAAGLWFVAFFLAWNTASVGYRIFGDNIWTSILWAAAPLSLGVLVLRARKLDRWPFNEYPHSYFGWGWAVLAAALAVWSISAGMAPANPSPLPYIVLVNPLELLQAAILLVALLWIRDSSDSQLTQFKQPLRIGVAALGFGLLNQATARAVHYYAGVNYPIEHIIGSDAFQSTISILWTVLALLLMGFGTRRARRSAWIVGAGLLALVILKLFTVDLSNLAMVARIVSFISVGVLMLIIGYFAPIPPSRGGEAAR